MKYTTLIDARTLNENLVNGDWIIVDCRYDLADKAAGRRDYLEAHIPGAVYADLHDDLSGPPVTDHGRHPLPTPEALILLFSRLGINNDAQVIVYDNANGCFASRLWWMLRYMGHEAVAVLDGGWSYWEKMQLPATAGEQANKPGNFQGTARREWLVTIDKVQESKLLVDSRDSARYRGEIEPLDRVAGHIPGAINHFWRDNLEENGLFKDPGQLRQLFQAFLGATSAQDTVFYCGSGVTACHNLLAAAQAGLGEPRLYAGSWSEWSADPARPIATGEA